MNVKILSQAFGILENFRYLCINPNSGRNFKLNVMRIKRTKIEIWFDKMSQSIFLFKDDEKSHSFIKKGGNKNINEMVEKIKKNISETNDEFPDYIRFVRDSNGSWDIEGFFDENVGYDEDGKPSIVDFMSNVDEMEISLTDRGMLK